MANIHTLFEALLEVDTGKKIKVNGVANEREYETIRTALVKKWTEHKTIISAVGADDDPILEYGLCGNYSTGDYTATFYIGHSRRKVAKQYSFTIVDDDPPVKSDAPNNTV